MKSLFILIGISLFFTNTCLAGKIYKWRGPDGQIHYSSTPPPEADAETTGIKTNRGMAKPEKQGGDELNLEGLSDQEKIKALEEKLNKEKIRALEEKIKALEDGKGQSAGSIDKTKTGDDDVVMPDEDEIKKPDYSVQGQIRMLEETKRIEAMKTRCRAKARHGVDCNKPESYERF